VLAARLHVSSPTVSYHTKVLREAGLIISPRDGSAVVHHLTPLGAALLHGATSPIDPKG
jgi:DNA-binding transcriptional ArsR family regulator